MLSRRFSPNETQSISKKRISRYDEITFKVMASANLVKRSKSLKDASFGNNKVWYIRTH